MKQIHYVSPRSIKVRLFAVLLAAVAMIFPVGQASAQPITDPTSIMQWDDAQLDEGYWYHYRFSDMNGKRPVDFYLYQQDATTLVWLQNGYQEGGNAISQLSYAISKGTYSFTGYKGVNLLPAADKSWRTIHEAFDFVTGKRNVDYVVIENGRDKSVTQVLNIPKGYTIVYQQMGIDIGLFFRFLKTPVQPFQMYFLDTMNNVHTVNIRYEKDETVNGIPCKKYLIVGQGLLAVLASNRGAVWLANNGGPRYMVKFAMNVRLSWDYPNFLTSLVERKAMSTDEWTAFQENIVAEQQRSGRF
jgi:hypothetical protein